MKQVMRLRETPVLKDHYSDVMVCISRRIDLSHEILDIMLKKKVVFIRFVEKNVNFIWNYKCFMYFCNWIMDY